MSSKETERNDLMIHDPRETTFEIDFISPAALRRIGAFKNGRELVQRACALKGAATTRIFDATAGYGNDSIALAMAGADVIMAERCPEVAEALSRALRLGGSSGPAWLKAALERVTLIRADSIRYLGSLERRAFPDVILIDPMYPESGRSALSKKQLEMLRTYCGDDEDAPSLFVAARSAARRRVVVKRRLKAPALSGERPSYVLKGTTIRFDIYLTKP